MKINSIYIKKDLSVIAKYLGMDIYIEDQYHYISKIGYMHKMQVISTIYGDITRLERFKGYSPFVIDDENEWKEVI